MSYLRLTIGASDMNERVYSYDDLSKGETDADLARFSLGPDRAEVVPVLKQILAINPTIKILGSPWSAPAWMKTNNRVKGGELKPEYYGAYAAYFVKYIEQMKAEGIPIAAVTVQNEPLNPKNTPSMAMFAAEEDTFIARYLAPAFQRAGITTKILLYDHNPDVLSYALSILEDPAASKYVDGTAFHLYGGSGVRHDRRAYCISKQESIHDRAVNFQLSGGPPPDRRRSQRRVDCGNAKLEPQRAALESCRRPE